MDVATPAVQEFFEQYARSRSAMDIERLASQCMFAGQNGVQVPEKQAVLEGFPKALALLRTVGHTSTTVASVHEARLDERYVMVRARFVWRFEKAGAPPTDVDVDSVTRVR